MEVEAKQKAILTKEGISFSYMTACCQDVAESDCGSLSSELQSGSA